MSKNPFIIALLVLLVFSLFSPVETAGVTPTPITPTPIEPTPIKPTPITPTPIEPTPIEPTPITPTKITPTKITPTTIKPTPITPTPIKPFPPLTNEASTFFEVSASMTMMNGYNIGDRFKNWMDSTMASGSPAYFNFAGAILMPLDRKGEWYLGVGASVNVPPSHGVWGTSWSGFTRREFHLDPYILSVDAPIRYNLEDMGMSITITPSMLMAYCSGGYTGSIGSAPFSHYNVTAMGIGFGLSGGMQFYFDDNFGVEGKVGMRMLNAAISIDTGSTGYLTPADSSDIPLDLGGVYMTVGTIFKF